MKKDNDRVYCSIIIPAYNVEKYISACLDSVLKQSFRRFEIICINDNSTDGTGSILEKYQNNYSCIKVFTHKENQGLSASRNTGIMHSTGEYICFLDGDDMLVDNFFEKIVGESTDIIKPEIISYEIDVFYESDKVEKSNNKGNYYNVKKVYEGFMTGREMFCRMIENDDYVDSASNKLILREWLLQQNLEFVYGAYYEDSIFSLECLFRANKVIHIGEKLYKYRVRSGSIMTESFTYKNEYWRIWQLSECLRVIYNECRNECERSAVAKYARKMVSTIRVIYQELNIKDKKKLTKLSSVEGLLLECFGLANSSVYNADLQLEGLLSLIIKHERIVLYGAGQVGESLFKLIKKKGYDDKVIGFAVSDEIVNASFKCGKNVKYIGNYNAIDVDLVIISVSKDQDEMIEMATNLGFNNLRVVDGNMAHIIAQNL